VLDAVAWLDDATSKDIAQYADIARARQRILKTPA
jgi:hypothetical protein